MTPRLSTFAVLRAVLLGSVFAATAHGETSMTVTRCNADLDGNGIYQPVLQVAVNGETHLYRMGSDGLTRSIVFDSRAAIDWAVGLHAADATDVIYQICSFDGGNSTPAKPADTTDGGEENDTPVGGDNDSQGGDNNDSQGGNSTFIQTGSADIDPEDQYTYI